MFCVVRIVYVAEWTRKKILYLYVTVVVLPCTNIVTELRDSPRHGAVPRAASITTARLALFVILYDSFIKITFSVMSVPFL